MAQKGQEDCDLQYCANGNALRCPQRTSSAHHVATLAGLKASRTDYTTSNENHKTASGQISAALLVSVRVRTFPPERAKLAMSDTIFCDRYIREA